MTNHRLYFFCTKHLCFGTKEVFIFSVINFCIACCYDQHALITHFEGQGFSNTRRFTTCSLRRQLYSSTGSCKFDNSIFYVKLFKISTNFLNRQSNASVLNIVFNFDELLGSSSHILRAKDSTYNGNTFYARSKYIFSIGQIHSANTNHGHIHRTTNSSKTI